MKLFRALLCAFAAIALVLAPTAASAYTGDDGGVVVSDSNPEAGQPFNVVVDAGTGSPEATLTVTSEDPDVPDSSIEIAGTQSMTKATNAGLAEFTVTLNVEGRYTLVGTDASGNVVGEAVVVVGDGVAGGGDSGGDDSAAGGLPDTGAGAGTTLLGGAGALLLAGGAALLFTRRRKATLAA